MKTTKKFITLSSICTLLTVAFFVLNQQSFAAAWSSRSDFKKKAATHFETAKTKINDASTAIQKATDAAGVEKALDDLNTDLPQASAVGEATAKINTARITINVDFDDIWSALEKLAKEVKNKNNADKDPVSFADMKGKDIHKKLDDLLDKLESFTQIFVTNLDQLPNQKTLQLAIDSIKQLKFVIAEDIAKAKDIAVKQAKEALSEAQVTAVKALIKQFAGTGKGDFTVKEVTDPAKYTKDDAKAVLSGVATTFKGVEFKQIEELAKFAKQVDASAGKTVEDEIKKVVTATAVDKDDVVKDITDNIKNNTDGVTDKIVDQGKAKIAATLTANPALLQDPVTNTLSGDDAFHGKVAGKLDVDKIATKIGADNVAKAPGFDGKVATKLDNAPFAKKVASEADAKINQAVKDKLDAAETKINDMITAIQAKF